MNIKTELELLKKNYDSTIERVDGLPFSQKNLIRTIEFYTDSKYLNGQEDDAGEKPFYNILNGICDVENAAKDLDTKDINITSDDPNHYLESWLLSKDIQVWMKQVNFGKVLNDIRDADTRYGSVLAKKCIKKQEDGAKLLEIELPEWKNVITDQVDILKGAKVEIHYMTAGELSEMTEWENIDSILDKLVKQGSSKRIPIYEIRGKFPLSVYKEVETNGKTYKSTKKDERTYTEQLYYIAGNPTESGKSNFVDGLTTLYWENDTDKVYKYKARKKRAGRGFGVGVMEEGEDAQVWTNDTVLKQHRAMAYTSKVIGQTASKKLKGRNLLTETDDGTILETEDGKPITSLQLLPAGGLNQYNNLIVQWNSQLEKTTSAYAAQRGDTPPSGTPYRLEATIINQSNSVFVNLLEDLGIFVGELFNDWIMPLLATKLNQEHILAYEFSAEELKEIDKNFSIRNANEMAKQKVLSGGSVTPEEYETFIQNYDSFIKQTKGQRFIQIPKNFYKNLKAKVTVNITGEQKNKAAVLESLNNVLVTYGNMMKMGIDLSKDPVSSLLLNEIIEQSGAGISPSQIIGAISQKSTQAQQQPTQPTQQQPQTMPPAPPLSLTANPQ